MSKQASDLLTSYYDRVPYDSHPFGQTAIEHLASRAFIFGLDAPAPTKARVLELGCASGGNLIPFAARFPEASVVGVDLSSVQIGQGLAAIELAGLKNIRLLAMDVTQIDASFGQFDYIVCHGVYSWVPGPVQDAILRVCAENLAPTGIAYVSYNVYPGWKAREIVRDAMLLRGGPRETPAEKLSFGRGMLEFLEQSAKPDSVLKKALEETMPIVKNANPSYLLHEFFEPFNAPCYFKEFLARAGVQELSYLCEAETSAMFVQNYQESVREPLLNECGGSQIVMEQYLDFLVNRTFRQTLLIKSDRASQIQYRLHPERLRALHYAGFFTTRDGTSIAIDHSEQACSAIGNRQVMLRNPVHKAVAQTLEERYPATIDVDTLVAEVAARTSEALATAESSTMAMLEELVILGAVRTRCEAPGIALGVSKKPRAIDVVRRSFGAVMQADRPASACSQWHEGVAVVPLESFLLPLLDGHHTHDMLVKDVAKAALAEELVFSKDGQALGRSEVPNDFVRAEVVKALQSLRRKGFLTA